MSSDIAKLHLRDGWTTEEIERDLKQQKEQRRIIEEKYAHLPPLPPGVRAPVYMVQGAPAYARDAASRGFYAACAQGRIDEVRDVVARSRPPPSDLQYGLEEASHSFQVKVVRYLIEEQNVELHTRVFRRRNYTRVIPLKERPPPSSQCIFASDSPELIELLKVFLDNGWHPNQLLSPVVETEGPCRRVLQDVALHYSRCLWDTPVLELLLRAGADPTIARDKDLVPYFEWEPEKTPTQRMSGDILALALHVGTTETIDLLLAHGAKVEYGSPLHSLVQRENSEHSEVPIPYPLRDLDARCRMGDHLLELGVDINEVKNVYV